MDVAVRHHLVPEAGLLVHAEGSGYTVVGFHGPGCEQIAAVGGHRQIRVMRPFPHECEEGQDARPRAEAAREVATPGGGSFEPFEQSVQAVALVVQRVVAGQQIARLREQDHHQPHGHPAGGAVDLGGAGAEHLPDFVGVRRGGGGIFRQMLDVFLDVVRFPDGRQGVAVGADQDLDRFAYPLAEHLRELGLPLARVADGLQQRRFGALRLGRPESPLQQGAQRGHLRRQLALLEPELEVPLAPRVVVEPRKHQPPLPAVRHQGQMLAAGAQPAEHPAHDAAAPADAELPAVVQEHRQPGAARPLPQVAGLDGLAGDGAPSPGGSHVAAARPGAGRGIEAAHLLEHEGDEGRCLGAAVQHRAGALTELPLGPAAERGGRMTGERGEARAVEQQPAVAQAIPAGQTREAGSCSRSVGFRPRHRLAQCDGSGRRTSTATGKTCAWPARAKRAGRRWSRIRSRSRCNCSRISS